MLNLSKQNKTPILKIAEGEVIKFGKKEYRVRSTIKGYYLAGMGCSNDSMFADMKITSKKSWCEKHGITANYTGVFPYMDTHNLLKFIKTMKEVFASKESPLPF